MPANPIHHDEDNEWVTGRLKLFRKQKGITQTDLAEAVGDVKYRKHISSYENGHNHIPFTLLCDIMTGLGVSPTEVLPPRLFGVHASVIEEYLQLNEEHQETIRTLVHTMLQAEGKD